MPTFEITSPEGKTYEIDGPEGATQEQALAQLQTHLGQQQGESVGGLAKSLGSGLVKGAIGLAALPGTIHTAIGNAIGLRGGSPNAEQLQRSVESNITGPLYKPQTIGQEYAQTIGEFAPGALMGGGSIPSRVVGNVVAPALASEAAGQATKGMGVEPYARLAGALASPLAAGAVRRTITPLPMAPARQGAVNALENEGVQLTAGQRTGNRPLQWFEQSFGDIPGAGEAGTRAYERASEGFTRAALNRVGENADRATPDVVNRAFNRIGTQFDALASRNTLHPDQQLGHDLQGAITDYYGLVSPPNRSPQIQNFLQEIGQQFARNANTIPGDAFQSITSRLDRAARAARAHPEVANTLRDMRNALNGGMERSISVTNPNDLGAWQDVRNQYRNMLVIERAATAPGEAAASGLISPSQLRTAAMNIQQRRAYARGVGDFAELARSGEQVMRSLPQSGTAPRSYAMHLPATIAAGLGGLTAGVPGAAAGALMAAAGPPIAGRLLMSRPIQAYLGNQLIGRTPNAPLTNALLRGILSQTSVGILGR